MKVIEVTIANALTSRLMMFALAVPADFTSEQIECLHKMFEEFNPDCHVNFDWNGEKHHNFICGMPVNMRLDQNRLTFDQYFTKWYCKTKFSETAMQDEGTHVDLIDSAIRNLNLN